MSFEDTYHDGPQQDKPLALGVDVVGEVALSGYVYAQAWHGDPGVRDLYFAVYDGEELVTSGIEKCEFVNGRLEHKINFGMIYLPMTEEYRSYRTFFLVWNLSDPDGGPAYTGMPHFNCALRARNF